VAFAELGVTNRKPMRNTKQRWSTTNAKMIAQPGVSLNSFSLKKTSQKRALATW
jgi:hypothetical protein